jgi:hypothetical protein
MTSVQPGSSSAPEGSNFVICPVIAPTAGVPAEMPVSLYANVFRQVVGAAAQSTV